MELVDLSATEAARQIRSRTISSEELVRACAQRINEREGEVRAWQYFDPDHAIRQAAARDTAQKAGQTLGLLHGVPVGIKDIIATADMPTEDGTPINKGRQPASDAGCVAALREAGAVIMGKTVTTELAARFPGKTRNPHNTAHTPGGSSSGSAAAVACGMVPLALGTQTGGSVIRPASFCGIYGLKPTLGMISRAGVTLQSHTLDTVGVYGCSVDDLALITEALSLSDPTDPVSYPRARASFVEMASPGARAVPDASTEQGIAMVAPKFGFMRTPAWEAADRSAQEAILEFVAEAGFPIAELSTPPSFVDIIEAHKCIQHSENVYHFAEIEARGRALLSPTLCEALDAARTISARDYLQAQGLRDVMNADFEALLSGNARLAGSAWEGGYDAVLCLASCGSAPRGLDWTGDPVFNGMWTYLGVPTVTLPLLQADGLPLGLQVVGKRRDEARLLRAAQWLSQRFTNAPA